MGKNVISQRRGRGTPTYRCPSHRYSGKTVYNRAQNGEIISGVIKNILHDASRNAPLGEIVYSDNTKGYLVLSEGTHIGQKIVMGNDAPLASGNIIPVSKIPEGTPVFNIEIKPGDGGKMVRSSGAYALIVSHDVDKTIISMPSKKFKNIHPYCKATIGVVAGGERKIKPFTKAGTKWYAARARGRLWPRTGARAMNAVDHKFGGSNMGCPKTVSRHAPPGSKVGSIAARRTGRQR